MKLLVISHTPHYRKGGQVAGWGPTVRELDQLATLTESLVHLAPLHGGPAPESVLPYEAGNIRLRLVPAAGGEGAGAKLSVLAAYPRYAAAIAEELERADAVHVRCPSNIGMLAAAMLVPLRSPKLRWIKYAGNWRPQGGEAWSYRVQRWLLRGGWTRAQVTVNGEWPGDGGHIRAFLNPCLTDAELDQARQSTAGKRLNGSPRLLYVGRLEEEKGALRAIAALERLRERGIEALLDLVGDGPARRDAEARAAALPPGAVRLHGWLPRPALGPLYGQAHFLVLPSRSSEGWPKVLSEAMAYGALPLAGAVSSIPQLLGRYGCGRSLEPLDVESFASAAAVYAERPQEWLAESARAKEAAAQFTYGRYLEAAGRLLGVRGGLEEQIV